MFWVRIGFVALLLASAPVAAQSYVFSVGDVMGMPGETVNVPITFETGNGQVSEVYFWFCYNAAEIDVVDVNVGSDIAEEVQDFDFTLGPNYFTVTIDFGDNLIPAFVSDVEIATLRIELNGSNGSLIAASCPGIGGPFSVEVENGFGGVGTGYHSGAIEIGPVNVAGRPVIFDGERSSGLNESTEALYQAMHNSGMNPIIIQKLDMDRFVGMPQSVWAMCGTFPNNHILSELDGIFLSNMVFQGVDVYIEGSDVFAYDPPTLFRDYDGVGFSTDGDDSFIGMNGANFGPLQLSSFSSSYSQDNLGLEYTDRLTPADFDLPGPNAGVIWRDNGAGGDTTAYATGIFYNTSGSWGQVIAQSWEFGGYNGVKSALLQQYQLAFGNASLSFDRGDANADGSRNLADALLILSYVGGDGSLGCLDAADTNDDGSVNIADAIYFLNYLFNGGPDTPGPTCGQDPTADFLGCSTGTPCLF